MRTFIVTAAMAFMLAFAPSVASATTYWYKLTITTYDGNVQVYPWPSVYSTCATAVPDFKLKAAARLGANFLQIKTVTCRRDN